LPTTGTPILNTDLISKPFALADPVPFTVAILTTTSLTVDTKHLSRFQWRNF